MSEHEIPEEEKIIICCNLLTGSVKAIEAKAHLVACCDSAPIPPELAHRAIRAAQVADRELREVLRRLTEGTP